MLVEKFTNFENFSSPLKIIPLRIKFIAHEVQYEKKNPMTCQFYIILQNIWTIENNKYFHTYTRGLHS